MRGSQWRESGLDQTDDELRDVDVMRIILKATLHESNNNNNNVLDHRRSLFEKFSKQVSDLLPYGENLMIWGEYKLSQCDFDAGVAI